MLKFTSDSVDLLNINPNFNFNPTTSPIEHDCTPFPASSAMRPCIFLDRTSDDEDFFRSMESYPTYENRKLTMMSSLPVIDSKNDNSDDTNQRTQQDIEGRCPCHLDHSHSGVSNLYSTRGGALSSNKSYCSCYDDQDYVIEDNESCCHRQDDSMYGHLHKYLPEVSLSKSPESCEDLGDILSEALFGCCCPAKPSSEPGESSVKEVQTYVAARDAVKQTIYGSMNDPWRMDDTLSNKKLFTVVVLLVVLFGATTGLLVGLAVLSQVNLEPRTRGVACADNYFRCGEYGCVHQHYICTTMRSQCPDVVSRKLMCPEPENSTHANMADEIWDDLQREANAEEFITVVSRQEVPVRDSLGWVTYPRGSSNGSKYIVINKSMTFNGAQDQCRKYGGYLAHINSLREQVFLEDFLVGELQIGDYMRSDVGFWIGARRPRGGHGGTCMYDQWKWVDPYGRTHGSITGFTAFVPGKPDNYYSPEECLYMRYAEEDDDKRFLKWDDAPCDLHSIGGIKTLCEVELA